MTRTTNLILSNHKVVPGNAAMLLAVLLAGSTFVLPASSQSVAPAAPPATSAAPAAKPAAPAGAPTRYQPNRFPRRAAAYYSLFWGVDSLTVKAVESGELIRFSYHVLDPDKAKQLNDKDAEPGLIFPERGVRLKIPTLEKVGQLRQKSAPEAGRSYWMAFSNPGRTVKRGDRVNVVIGQFRAQGLIVE